MAVAPRSDALGAKRNGGRHCCQPPLRRAKDLPVFVTWLLKTLKALTNPLSILAHQLRRRFPSELLPLARSPADLLDCAARRLACLSTCPAWPEFDPKTELQPKPPDVPRPFLGKPLLRPALLTKVPKNPRNRVAREAIPSSGASYQLAPQEPESSSHCLPAEIGPLVTCRTLLPLPALWGGRDRRPDHMSTMHIASESRKQNFR